MSKNKVFLSTLICLFISISSACSIQHSRMRGAVLNKNSIGNEPSSSSKISNVVSFSLGCASGAIASAVVTKEFGNSTSESNYWKNEYEKSNEREQQLKKENEILMKENKKLKNKLIPIQNKNIDESPSNLIHYYDVGKILYDCLNNNKKAGRGMPLEYLDNVFCRMSGVKDVVYCVLDPRNEDKSNSNRAIFKRILNGDNILMNFYSLPKQFQKCFIEVAIKNMAAIQATEAANVKSMLGAQKQHFDFKYYYPYFEQCQKIAKA